jgi:hypothetical protein
MDIREFWRKQPKWLWAIALGAVMIEAGGAVAAYAAGKAGRNGRTEA